jgi:glycosyltransferase involved in cell wall biosynthesis
LVPLLEREGFNKSDSFVGMVGSADIPRYLSAADAAVSFIKPCYSKQASSPTKNAEYLAAGLPIVINDGIGDSTRLTVVDGVGVVLNGLSLSDLSAAANEIREMALTDPTGTAERCRESARNRFGLGNVGGEHYRRLYDKLSKG